VPFSVNWLAVVAIPHPNKEKAALQQRLEPHWVLHNFVRRHYTTNTLPAVALGIILAGLSWLQLFSNQYFPFN